MKKLLLGILLPLSLFAYTAQKENPHFFIVIPTYHNKEYCIQNIQALVDQEYTNWTAYIAVDGNRSDDDGTGDLLEAFVKEHNLEDKITIHRNSERLLALHNIFDAIHSACPDDEWVVGLYDGDDWFYTNKVLDRVAREYRDNDAWFTYGQYINYPQNTLGNCRPFPQQIADHNNFRSYPWIASHFRTFKAGLFKRIKKEDLMHEGKFFPMAWDVAFLPMLEMATQKHIRFIPDILYVYRHHQFNDYNVNYPLLAKMEAVIRSRAPYQPLESNNNSNSLLVCLIASLFGGIGIISISRYFNKKKKGLA